MANVDFLRALAVLSAGLLSVATIFLLLKKPSLLTRFATVTSIGWLIVFSWPVALFGSNFVFGAVSRVFFFCVMFLPPLVLLLWAWLRGFPNCREDEFGEQIDLRKKLDFSVWGLAILGAIILVWPMGIVPVIVLLVICIPSLLYLLWVGLRRRPPAGQRKIAHRVSARGMIEVSAWTLGIAGTAILVSSLGFANLAAVVAVFDPDNSYNAREQNIKLNPSNSAWFAWGLVINVFLPIAAALAGLRLISGIQTRKMMSSIAASSAILFLHPLALTTGAKGNLIPLYIGLVAALIYGLQSKWRSGLALLLVGCSGLLGLAVWSAYAERPSSASEGNTGAIVAIPAFVERTSDFTAGVIRRGLVVPSEVALQNMRFAEEEAKLDLAILPFFPFAKSDINVASEVARIYQPDTFANFPLSTAPTSSIILLPAHLGIFGLAIALALLIVLDEVLARLTRGRDRMMSALSLALVGVMAYLTLVSEFQTIIIAHGGAGIFVALVAFSAIRQVILRAKPDDARV